MRIFHFFANDRNVGDRCSALAIREIIEFATQNLGIKSSYKPVRIESPRYSLNRNRIQSAVDQISSRDLVILGGGALLHPYFSHFWNILFGNSEINNLVLLGIGATENQKSSSNELGKLFENNRERFAIVVSRDDLTSNFFASSHISSVQNLCPSLYYFKSQMENVGEKSKLEEQGGQILFVRHKEIESVGLYKNGNLINFEQLSESNFSSQKWVETNNVSKFGSEYETRWILNKYFNSDVVVTSRLHGAVIAFAAYKPVVSFNFDQKIDDFMKSVFSASGFSVLKESACLIEKNDLNEIETTISNLNKIVGNSEKLRRSSIIENTRSFYQKLALQILKDFA